MRRLVPLVLLGALAAACGGGGAGFKEHGRVTAAGPPAAQTAEVGMTDALIFTPNVVLAKVGTLTITADNLGRVPHDLVFDEQGLGQSDRIDGKQAADVKAVLSRPGAFAFQCTLHPGMTGKVIVS